MSKETNTADAVEFVHRSGKGGTGKTSITATFAYLAQERVPVKTVLTDKENSGKLVTLIKQKANTYGQRDPTYRLLLIDGPPGIGCPVIAASTGADLALIVTEPTTSGIHDLERIVKTTKHFRLPTLVCINKAVWRKVLQRLALG